MLHNLHDNCKPTYVQFATKLVEGFTRQAHVNEDQNAKVDGKYHIGNDKVDNFLIKLINIYQHFLKPTFNTSLSTSFCIHPYSFSLATMSRAPEKHDLCYITIITHPADSLVPIVAQFLPKREHSSRFACST